MGEKEWIIKVKSVLKNLFNIDYEKVDCSSLWGIRLVILAKPEHSQKISHVQHSQVLSIIATHMQKNMYSETMYMYTIVSKAHTYS